MKLLLTMLVLMVGCSDVHRIQIPGPPQALSPTPDPVKPPPTVPTPPPGDDCAVRDHCQNTAADELCVVQKFQRGADYKGETVSDAEFKGKECILLRDNYWNP